MYQVTPYTSLRRLQYIMQQPSQLAAAYIYEIYDTISMGLDYAVTWWDDSQYRFHLRSLVSEQEWMQFKTEFLRIYAEQNAKRAALRKLIQFNRYRGITHWYITLLSNVYFYLTRCRRDLLRDPHWMLRCIQLCLYWILFLPLVYAYLGIMWIVVPLYILCLVLDLLLIYPRYLLFRDTEKAFLDAVMTANPDLDPVLVEEELVQQLRQLTVSMTRHHPGVHCQFTSTLHRKEFGENKTPYYLETFQIQFLNSAPVVQL